MNSPAFLMALEVTKGRNLFGKLIKQVGDAQIHIPSNFKSNLANDTRIRLRVNY